MSDWLTSVRQHRLPPKHAINHQHQPSTEMLFSEQGEVEPQGVNSMYCGTTQPKELRRRAGIHPDGRQEPDFADCFRLKIRNLTRLYEAALVSFPYRGEGDRYWQRVADKSENEYAFNNLDLARDACLIFQSVYPIVSDCSTSYSEAQLRALMIERSDGKALSWFNPEYRRLIRLIALFESVDQRWGQIGCDEDKLVLRTMGDERRCPFDTYVALRCGYRGC